jgi:8-amino-7-oxononanoate synthase
VDWLANRARTYVFSTAQPASLAAAALAALDIVENEPLRRRRVLERADSLRQRLTSRGWNTGNSNSQIIPLIVGEAERAMDLAGRLRAAGLYLPAIRPPTVPVGQSLLRISLSYNHTLEVMDRLVEALGPA